MIYRAIFRRIPAPVALVDRDLVVHDASDAFARLASAALPSLLGARLSVVFPDGASADAARAAVSNGSGFACDAAVTSGASVVLRIEAVDRDGDDEIRGLVVLEPVNGAMDDGRLVDLFASIRAIKHEINNPLTGALGNINLLLRRQDLDEKTRKRLATAEQEIKKVSQIVLRLSELAPSPESKATTDA